MNNRVAIVTKRNKEDAEQWLNSHGIIGYDDLVANDVALEGEDLKKRQFILSRGKSTVEMYVDSDPAMCAWVFENQNVTSLLFSHPGYVRVEHRPDAPKKVRAWSDIEESINRVNIARSEAAKAPKEQSFFGD